MTATQLNAELLRELSTIVDDEILMEKVLKYIKKLKAPKADPTLMTKEEFFACIDEAKKQYEEGKYTTLLPGESVTDMLKRKGYDI
ncbi:MAG: hypothetical protein IKQ46_10985 [Bacteroidales bacterium]|jgi:hypothetical protein|nr:hypothetical protein [Bacteroidales bacterium]